MKTKRYCICVGQDYVPFRHGMGRTGIYANPNMTVEELVDYVGFSDDDSDECTPVQQDVNIRRELLTNWKEGGQSIEIFSAAI